jgi:hypothetical protein
MNGNRTLLSALSTFISVMSIGSVGRRGMTMIVMTGVGATAGAAATMAAADSCKCVWIVTVYNQNNPPTSKIPVF